MKIDECDMEKFGTLENTRYYSRENNIAVMGDRWWPHDGHMTAKQEGVKIRKKIPM